MNPLWDWLLKMRKWAGRGNRPGPLPVGEIGPRPTKKEALDILSFPWSNVHSTIILAIKYDAPNAILYIQFKTRRVYAYSPIHPQMIVQMMASYDPAAGSGIGVWFWDHIRRAGFVGNIVPYDDTK